MSDALRAKACDVLMPLRHGLGRQYRTIEPDLLTWLRYASFTAPAMMHAMDHLGVAQQFLTRLGLESWTKPGVLEAGKNDWMQHLAWQPLRHLVGRPACG